MRLTTRKITRLSIIALASLMALAAGVQQVAAGVPGGVN